MIVIHIRFPDGNELYMAEPTYEELRDVTFRWQAKHPENPELPTYTRVEMTQAEYDAIPATSWAYELTTDDLHATDGLNRGHRNE
jgi:hypothetical protein